MRKYACHPLVVCEAHPGQSESLAEELSVLGYDVRPCPDEESMIEAMAARRPVAVVYELRHQVHVDVAILALLRRLVPDVPLVLVTRDLAAAALRALCVVHPDVLTTEPVARVDLRAAVRTAVRHARARRRYPEPVTV